MITEIVLQPILENSEIPFDKYLLLYDGKVTMTGRLKAITRQGFQFSRIGVIDMFAFLATIKILILHILQF